MSRLDHIKSNTSTAGSFLRPSRRSGGVVGCLNCVSIGQTGRDFTRNAGRCQGQNCRVRDDGRAFAIFEEVGDLWSESTLLADTGLLLDEMGRTAEAVTYLEQCVALDEAIGHPDLESAHAELERVRGKLGNG